MVELVEREIALAEILLQQQVRKNLNRVVGIGEILACVESRNHRAARDADLVARRFASEVAPL